MHKEYNLNNIEHQKYILGFVMFEWEWLEDSACRFYGSLE